MGAVIIRNTRLFNTDDVVRDFRRNKHNRQIIQDLLRRLAPDQLIASSALAAELHNSSDNLDPDVVAALVSQAQMKTKSSPLVDGKLKIVNAGGMPLVGLGSSDSGHGPGDGCAPSAGCGGCGGGCSPPYDGLANNAGDTPGDSATILLRTVLPSCGSVLNSNFQQQYSQKASSFSAQFGVAKSRAISRQYNAVGVSTGAPLVLTLSAAVGVVDLLTLGVSLRLAPITQGSNAPVTVRIVGVALPGGVYDSDDILVQPDSTTGIMSLEHFAFNNINQGSYYYAPLLLPASPGGITITVTGLPTGYSATARSIPTDSPLARSMFGQV